MDGLDFVSSLKTMKLQTVADHTDRIQVQVTKLTGGEGGDTFSPPGLGDKRTMDPSSEERAGGRPHAKKRRLA